MGIVRTVIIGQLNGTFRRNGNDIDWKRAWITEAIHQNMFPYAI